MSPKVIIIIVVISIAALAIAAIYPFLTSIYFSLKYPSSNQKQDQALLSKLEKLQPSPSPKIEVNGPFPRQKHPEFYSYYYISGTTAQELREKLNSAGPKDVNGVAHDAMTYYDLSSSFKYKQENGTCSIGSFDVKLNMNILLPKWQNPQDASSPGLASRWDKYIDVLENHESLHTEIAMDQRDKLITELKAIPSRPKCIDAGNQFSALITKYNQESTEKENAFDKATIYGRTQGVIFP